MITKKRINASSWAIDSITSSISLVEECGIGLRNEHGIFLLYYRIVPSNIAVDEDLKVLSKRIRYEMVTYSGSGPVLSNEIVLHINEDQFELVKNLILNSWEKPFRSEE